MKHSEQLDQLAAALAKAQGAIRGAVKDAQNPHFRSRYATLAAHVEAIREAFAANGLSYTQAIVTQDAAVGVETLLAHSSGQWLHAEPFYVPVSKADAQGFGSALTYCRRYALAAIAGIAPEDDDDGNAATAAAPPAKAKPDPAKFAGILEGLRADSMAGTERLKAAWKAISPEAREALAGELDGLKHAASLADKAEKVPA